MAHRRQESKPAKELNISRRDKKYTNKKSLSFEKRQAAKGERVLAKARIRNANEEENTTSSSHGFTLIKLREVVQNSVQRREKRKLEVRRAQKQREMQDAQARTKRKGAASERQREKLSTLRPGRRTEAERLRKRAFIRQEQGV